MYNVRSIIESFSSNSTNRNAKKHKFDQKFRALFMFAQLNSVFCQLKRIIVLLCSSPF